MSKHSITVDLIRHAESAMNVQMENSLLVPFIGGRQNEVELSPRGIEQAQLLGRYALKNNIVPQSIYCSPAVRSMKTCDISANEMNLNLTKTVDNRLQELDQGDWTNQPRSIYDLEENKRAMQSLSGDFRPPNGQSMNDVADAIESFLTELAQTITNGEHIWVHTHGVAIKAFIGRTFGWSHTKTYQTAIDNVSLSRVVYVDGYWNPVFINKSSLIG